MPTDSERDALIDVIVEAAPTGENDALAKAAALQAGTTLAKLTLNDIKRIADSLEILAKSALDQQSLFGK